MFPLRVVTPPTNTRSRRSPEVSYTPHARDSIGIGTTGLTLHKPSGISGHQDAQSEQRAFFTYGRGRSPCARNTRRVRDGRNCPVTSLTDAPARAAGRPVPSLGKHRNASAPLSRPRGFRTARKKPLASSRRSAGSFCESRNEASLPSAGRKLSFAIRALVSSARPGIPRLPVYRYAFLVAVENSERNLARGVQLARVSPSSGSTLMTSAPRSASTSPQLGPMMTCTNSTTRMPCSGSLLSFTG